MTEYRNRLAVIGAGPIGLEAALHASAAGFDVHVFERGTIAENIRNWGHVRLFSPFGMNASLHGQHEVARITASPLPLEDALLTGHEYAERYLLPLSRLPQLAQRVHEQTEVLAVGRSRLLKGEAIGQPQRALDPFRLLLRDDNGEREHFADYVFDCSGVYPHHNVIGAGGTPCLGERESLSPADYCLPDITGSDRDRFAGRRTAVLGNGYSAASAVVSLAELAATAAETSVLWLTRTGRTPPVPLIENDALPERDRLAREANRLATQSGAPVIWKPSTRVTAITRVTNADGFELHIEAAEQSRGAESNDHNQRQTERLAVDRVIANVGYRPDRTLYEELQVHECYATSGPIKLAAALLGQSSTDCLTQTSHGVETLCNPEPGFYILGAKSYGRDSRFLIHIGLQQVRDVLDSLVPSKNVSFPQESGVPASSSLTLKPNTVRSGVDP